MFSIWEKRSFQAPAELAVVGAGIVGLCTALHYRRRHPGHRVVVLERGPHPSGASVKNAGFACFGSPSELLHDLDTLGEEAALRRVEERWRGLLELRGELGDAAIGFEPVGGYELFRDDASLYTKVADRFDALNGSLHGIFGQPAFSWVDHRIKEQGLHAAHLSYNKLEGAVDSGKMMRALLRKVQGEGVEVEFGTAVAHCREHGDGVNLDMADGTSLRASRAVIATNGFTGELLPGIDVVPARGQVLLTAPVEGLRLKGTFHVEEGFYYFREYDGRVLLGGARNLDLAGEATTEEGVTLKIQNALERMLRGVILPGKAFTIDQRWSGVMGFRTKGGPALVEHLSPRVIVAAGLGGIGVAVGIRVARKAAELIDLS